MISDELYNKCVHYAKQKIEKKFDLAYDIVHDLILNKGDELNEESYKSAIFYAIKKENSRVVTKSLGDHVRNKAILCDIRCIKCNEILYSSQFPSKIRKDGFYETTNICIDCQGKERNKRNVKNRLKPEVRKREKEYYIQQRKSFDEIQKQAESIKRHNRYIELKSSVEGKCRIQKQNKNSKNSKNNRDRILKEKIDYYKRKKDKEIKRVKERRKLVKDTTAKDRAKRFLKKQTAELGDWYIKRLLLRYKKYTKEQITPELIHEKRNQIIERRRKKSRG